MNPNLPDREYWNDFTGNEFGMVGNSRSQLQRALSEMVKQSDKIVNLMCGRYAHVHSALGMDISDRMLVANEEIDRSLVWDINDSTKPYPIEDGSFDVAVMISGIAYLRHPEHTFSETGKILRPNGKFIVGYDHNQTPKGTDEWKSLDDEARLSRLQQLYNGAGFGYQEIKRLSINLGFGMFGIGPKTFYLVSARKK
jgi:SAM-dependent methyltransferase